MVWKKKGKIVHPNDIDHCWAQPVHTGWLSHRESFELIEQTKMYDNSSQPGKFVNIRTENDVTGWMWLVEYETLYQPSETLEVGKLYTASNTTLPKNCILMEQIVRAKPVSNAAKISVDCWQNCFVLLGYNSDHHWINVLTGAGYTGWVRNMVELKLAAG
jgi:hypothetical protein